MKCKTCGTDHRGVAKHGGYCLNHQEQRAEAAEARAASKSELIDIIIATWEQMTERLLDSEAQRNTAWSELREIREAIHADENEATSDEVQRVVRKRDELARKLEQAQQALRSIEDQAGRAALVQDRSVSIIKQTCKIIADKAKAAMAA